VGLEIGEDRLDCGRHLVDGLLEIRALRPAGRELIEHRQRRGVCLGGRDRLLLAGMGQQRELRSLHDRRIGGVGQGDGHGAEVTGCLQHLDHVRCLARLRYPDDDGVLDLHPAPVDGEQRRRGGRHDHAVDRTDDVAQVRAGVV